MQRFYNSVLIDWQSPFELINPPIANQLEFIEEIKKGDVIDTMSMLIK